MKVGNPHLSGVPSETKGKAMKTLKAKGKAEVKVKIAFTPTAGAKVIATHKVTLIRK
jgi:hypothetical protein